MEYRVLGNTGIRVSRLAFGSLTIGPLQAGLPLARGAGVIRAALELGVNFIDTAELYGTYPYIREAIRGRSRDVVIASKSYAYTRQGMRESLDRARRELDRDYVDIFLLHEQESGLTIRGHAAALDFLLEAKQAGLVRAVGLSTHWVQAVRDAAWLVELDVLHPLFNAAGLGIRGGTADDMLAAVREACAAGKGVYAMKALGGGNLKYPPRDAFSFVRRQREFASVAVGMQSVAEVRANVALFSDREVPDDVLREVERIPRRLVADEGCTLCGTCVASCPQKVLRLGPRGPVVDEGGCLHCGYCGAACPEFLLRIV
ncbi:MAG: aldo/keto reductase [Peptococcaceae bacterium]|jgi:aryl-alcohol dehydrogenase-like predicted oxidoreductase|nr:aldo/keto reductase [Peptococcaceae bacterium]